MPKTKDPIKGKMDVAISKDVLEKYPGVKIFQEGRNDGVYIHVRKGVFMGREFNQIAFCKFYEPEEGVICWQPRITKTKTGKKCYHFDIVCHPIENSQKIIDAIRKLVGLKDDGKVLDNIESVEEVKKKLEVEKQVDDISKLADEFDL